MRRGFTLLEMAIVVTLIGVITALAMPRISQYADRIAVRRAGDESAAFFNRARMAAVYRAVRVRVRFSGDSLIAAAESSMDSTVWVAPGPSRLGVTLAASRPEVRLYPNGLGLGGANLKLVFQKGTAADSLTISRLGRLRKWP